MAAATNLVTLAAGDAVAVVDPMAGGRLAGLLVAGRQLLVTGSGADHPMLWGSFPMVPYAGRVGLGQFRFEGEDVQLPVDLPPHAIHGCGYDHPWTVVEASPTSVALTLELAWPLGGRAGQTFELTETGLTVRGTVSNEQRAMPAQLGWHPWFVGPGCASEGPTGCPQGAW